MNILVTMYSFLIQAETYDSIEPEQLRQYPPVNLSRADDIKFLYRCLDKINRPAAFDRYNTRLVVDAANGKPAYAVDNQGNVLRGKQTYQLTPRAFLDLANFLEPYWIKTYVKH